MTAVYKRKPKEQRRVVVTGIGLVSPLGLDLTSTWSALIEGQSGIASIQSFDVSAFDVKIAGEVKNFNPDLYIAKKEQKKMDRFIHLAIAAAKMAVEDSGIQFSEALQPLAGCIVGAGMGGLNNIEIQHSVLMERGPSRISPFFIPSVISNLASGHISIEYGLKGLNYCVTSACASGNHSIGEATRYIRDGLCEVMVTGGAEATICPMAVGGFNSMKALSSRNETPQLASRPWDQDRDGFVLSEGAAILILENYEHAAGRGAKIYGEVTGYGASSDAYHITSPPPGGGGAASAMKMALQDATLNPNDIDYVNAHGTSTPPGDLLETQAIKSVFQDHSQKLWVSSTKSMIGHALGAAGALESAFCLMSLKSGVVPPTINLDNPSEGCDLDYVPLVAREKKLKHVLNNSFGFGGTNACLVFSQLES